MGEISSDGKTARGAISYALGSNGGYTLRDEKVNKAFFYTFYTFFFIFWSAFELLDYII